MVCIRGDWKTEMPGTGESGNGIMNQKAQQERYEGAALQVGQGERAEGQIEQTEQTKQAKQIKQTKRLRLRVPQSVERIKAMGLYRDYRALEKNDKVALTTAFSTALGGIMVIVKLAMGLWTMSVLFIVRAVYYAMLCISRFFIVKAHARTRQIADRMQRFAQERNVCHRTGALLCFIGLSYAAFSLTMFFTGSPNEYGEIIAITVATISFIKIGIAIRGMIVSYKTRNPLDSSVKFVTFIDAMLSLVVMQDVLLESQGTAHAAQSSDLFGIGLGTVAVIIGLWMLLRRKWTVAPNFNGRTD